jgi:hypothetical protein
MIKFVSIILPFLFVGCISSLPIYKIDDITDHIDGRRSTQLVGNRLAPAYTGTDVEFDAEKFIAWDGNIYYSIVLNVVSLNRLFIAEGESLVLLVDGTRIGFSGDGALGETAYYDVTPAQLKLIANAKDVRIKIKGAQFSVKRGFFSENFANLKRFIAEYVD